MWWSFSPNLLVKLSGMQQFAFGYLKKIWFQAQCMVSVREQFKEHCFPLREWGNGRV